MRQRKTKPRSRTKHSPLTRDMMLKAYKDDPTGDTLAGLLVCHGIAVRSHRYAPRPFKPLPRLG